ncbi:MAG: aminotransferase class V-fold PLP-dependent enzyme [Spirochaetota bacterium]
MNKKLIYMDHNATTPLHPEVKKALVENFDTFGNPSSMHEHGRIARQKVEQAREIIASFINADPSEIIFTSGGSESNNTVLKTFLPLPVSSRRHKEDRDEIVTSTIEHPCIMESVKYLEDFGVRVHRVGVDVSGKINTSELEELASERTALISIMMANNEIGTIQNIKEIAATAHYHGAYVHTDAVQAVGKIPVDVKWLDIDYLSISAHKLYGPKGVGALYIRKGSPLRSFIHGGHQEEGKRAGTINGQGIIGFGKAVEMARLEMDKDARRIQALKIRLKNGIEGAIPDIRINGHPTDTLPGTLNVSFSGAEGESILLYLDLEGVAVSTGSACATGSLTPSHVLLATGVGPELAHGSIRFSLGRGNTEQEVDYVVEKLSQIIKRIRDMSSVYISGGKSR